MHAGHRARGTPCTRDTGHAGHRARGTPGTRDTGHAGHRARGTPGTRSIRRRATELTEAFATYTQKTHRPQRRFRKVCAKSHRLHRSIREACARDLSTLLTHSRSIRDATTDFIESLAKRARKYYRLRQSTIQPAPRAYYHFQAAAAKRDA